MKIVHQAGRIHSNVDPISRLPRIPGHTSPLSIPQPNLVPDSQSQTRAQKAEDKGTYAPAAKAAFICSWEEICDMHVGVVTTRSKTKDLASSHSETFVKGKGASIACPIINKLLKGGKGALIAQLSSKEDVDGASITHTPEERRGKGALIAHPLNLSHEDGDGASSAHPSEEKRGNGATSACPLRSSKEPHMFDPLEQEWNNNIGKIDLPVQNNWTRPIWKRDAGPNAKTVNNKWNLKPHLLISADQRVIKEFVKGYLGDSFFKPRPTAHPIHVLFPQNRIFWHIPYRSGYTVASGAV
ncbi:hypothetical protein BDP27DRAFT_1420453 [Rhodocollybia butyracea]|uniref:Uncharacterized protein n=1 Tax=Rhodocollybia butyracea TaxID=206335 RepID=A0A9P5U8K5_9AGAR|nr:hypothetical protein BDP27DRAFT_1420453 [Rhodocollybia butyracea]